MLRFIKKRKITINNNKKIFLVLIFMSLSIGLWSNFKQIWLLENYFSVDTISFLLSLGMFGSCFLAIIISLFSTKVRIKEVLTLTFSISIISMLGLLFSYKSGNIPLIETFILLTIITENLYWIGIYPLFTTVEKTDKIYERKTILQNLFKDFGILLGGLVIGKTLGSFILDANFCLLLSIIFSMISLYFLLLIRYEYDMQNDLKTKDFITAFKEIFKNKIFIFYFLYCFFVNIAWDIVVGLQLILFTEGFKISESNSSYIILVFGMVATAVAIYTNKRVKFKNTFNAFLFRLMTKIVFYIPVIITGNIIFAVVAFAVTIFTSRAASSYTDGTFLNLADDDLQLMISNFRFFMICLGETVGIYLAGYLFNYGIKYIFLVSAIFYITSLIIAYILSFLYKKHKK